MAESIFSFILPALKELIQKISFNAPEGGYPPGTQTGIFLVYIGIPALVILIIVALIILFIIKKIQNRGYKYIQKDNLKCPECGKLFPGKNILDWHLDSVHGRKQKQ
jgi:hypothetical protein